LPASALEEVAAGGGAAIRRLAGRPEVAEALYLASPGLAGRWQAGADDGDGAELGPLERAVGAYVVRMATRATPFGLFAGTATGRIAEATRLVVPPASALVRRSRIDTGVLAALAEAVEADPETAAALVFRPTSSLYRAGGRLRYVEARTDGAVRTHHLVALDEDEALAGTLRRAGAGATVDELAMALAGPDVDKEEARAYVGELIAAGVLVSDLQPAITGTDPMDGMIAVLRRSPTTEEVADSLTRARATLAELDARGPGRPSDGYESVHRELAPAVAGLDAARLVQVDLTKPASGLTLGADVVRELAAGVELLRRVTPRRDDGLDRFRTAFEDRYGAREVPLCEALDEEAGIGFGASAHPGAEESPLLAGLDLGPPPEQARRWGRRERVLLDLLHRALAGGSRELALDAPAVERLAEPDPLPLPDALTVMATLVGSAREVADGTSRILVLGASGPSGAQLLGRFCGGDTDLESGVRAHLAAEEAHRPDAVYAEVVHLPEGRVGNILRRPVLRGHEIAYLGRSGAPEEHQLTVDRLTLGVEAGRIVLRCPDLGGREVLPRLSTAHNTAQRSLGLYRFLAALQYQGVASALAWDWGPLADAPFLPRVTAGRLVLARARWRLDAGEILALATAEGLERLRAERRLPRLVAVADGDNELPIDLDRPASVAIARHILAARDQAVLVEMPAAGDDLCATGPEGAFCHEVVVPFHRPVVTGRPSPAPPPGHLPRRFPPGSAWLYVKAYCGPAAADTVLRDAVSAAIAAARQRGALEQWFFVRYGDPDWHVRVRVAGQPDRLRDEVQPLLTDALAPLVGAGLVWRAQLDTYEREVERYGGDQGMLLAEEAFCADSDAVAGIVALLDGDGADARWRLALLGTDLLLDDLGLTVAERVTWAQRQRDGYGREFPGASGLAKQLGRRYRDERGDLEDLLWGDQSGHPLAPGVELLRARSERLRPLGPRLRALPAPFDIGDWAASVAHMHANRLLRSAARAQELAIHDLLARLYRSRLARTAGVHSPANRRASQ
jgi:thiopeptide-type bacteriocin biosynthesis protein